MTGERRAQTSIRAANGGEMIREGQHHDASVAAALRALEAAVAAWRPTLGRRVNWDAPLAPARPRMAPRRCGLGDPPPVIGAWASHRQIAPRVARRVH
jgi:hypothetical protein